MATFTANSEKPWRCRFEAEVSGFKIEQFLHRVAEGRALSFGARDFCPVSESNIGLFIHLLNLRLWLLVLMSTQLALEDKPEVSQSDLRMQIYMQHCLS